ncbi:MAG: flagellar biosynthesis protein [Betaproteobacteria bacterium]|nr:flagellar biosynthesis protein [Betaproteobacteria bacterium]
MPVRYSAAIALACAVLLGGCAAGRSVLPAGIDAGPNPAQGTAVRIAAVEDARVFSVRPPSPDQPSLMEDAEIDNKAITSRAVGRKRGGLGAALGDVLLPENTTVAALVQTALTRGLREAGYRVIASGEPGYEQAVPIRARVEQFWSWFSPGFAAVTLSNRAAVNLQGPLPPLEQGSAFRSEVSNNMQVVLESDWTEIVNKGLDALATAVRTGMR